MKQYDFAVAWDDTTKERFIKWVRKECSLKSLDLLMIADRNVLRVIESLEKGRIKVKFLLDCAADYYDLEDKFARLCYAVKDSGGRVVCDPDDARQAANKAVTHYDLLKANIPIPYTVVVRNWEPDNFKLTKEELRHLGCPFIIKPASGFGQKGVIKNATGSIEEIANARLFNRGDNFLLQEKIEPITLDGKQAWFRVYFLFGEIIPCWWNTETGFYNHLSLREMYNHKLLPLARITSEIARITNMEFFTSEIALIRKEKEKKFLVIDYVNDQPELRVRSVMGTKGFVAGPVPEVIEHIAQRFVELAWRIKHNIPVGMHRSIWLAKAKLEDESI